MIRDISQGPKGNFSPTIVILLLQSTFIIEEFCI